MALYMFTHVCTALAPILMAPSWLARGAAALRRVGRTGVRYAFWDGEEAMVIPFRIDNPSVEAALLVITEQAA